MKVLLVEDSERLQRSISAGLRKFGIAVDQAFDGIQGKEFLDAMEYEVIILDIMLPKLNGLEVLRDLRKRGDATHVLILSAKSQIEDRIIGLDLGADDYLIKPFAFDELLARIRALVRRTTNSKNPCLTFGNLSIDTSSRSITTNGEPINLTLTEYNIIEYLGRRRGRAISYNQLIFMIYDSQADVGKNTIEAHVSTLRKKLRSHGIKDLIKTHRGFGYIIEK